MKRLTAIFAGILVAGSMVALGADSTHQAKLVIASDAVVNITNSIGSVTLHQGTQRQMVVSSTTHSDKVEVDTRSTPDGRRIDVRSHSLAQQRPSSDEWRVELEISVPSGVSVIVNTATAPITVDGVNGDLSLSSDTGTVTVRNSGNSHLEVRGVSAPVVLTNVNGHVQVTSSGGSVQLNNVSGPNVTVGTTSGNITYQGDFAGGGSYLLTTHSGAIDVTLPATASVDLTARSVNGSVENDFPLNAKQHMSFTPMQGRSFAGTSNSGSSSVELQSFSGRIRVKKQ